LTDDPGDEPRTTPKLNCGALEKLLGFFDSFVVVLANEASVPNKMFLTSDEIGPVVYHALYPRFRMATGYAQTADVDTGL
jgi:hypothetical protein